MANKRMFTKQVTDDDAFIALSSSAQALYLHLMMGADDDGFNNQISIAMFKAHASVGDLQLLLEKRYVYQFDNGVIVIKHFRMANALRKDRYTPTVYQEELKRLCLKDNGAYSWLPNGCHVVAADKYRLVESSIDKDIESCISCQNKKEINISGNKDNQINKLSNKTIKTSISLKEMITQYATDDKIQELLLEFVELRKQKKKPLSERAMKMAFKELDKLAGTNIDLKQQIIEQTIYHSWDSFYALKDNKGKAFNQNKTIAEQAEEMTQRLIAKGILVEDEGEDKILWPTAK